MDSLNRIILQNGLLIDCTGQDPQENATVLVEGREIIKVTDKQTPIEGTVIDLGGRTIMPGLIDAHAHACIVEESLQMNKYPTAKFVCIAAKNLEDMLMQGFTTVRDAYGADWGFRVAVEEGYMKGPAAPCEWKRTISNRWEWRSQKTNGGLRARTRCRRIKNRSVRWC